MMIRRQAAAFLVTLATWSILDGIATTIRHPTAERAGWGVHRLQAAPRDREPASDIPLLLLVFWDLVRATQLASPSRQPARTKSRPSFPVSRSAVSAPRPTACRGCRVRRRALPNHRRSAWPPTIGKDSSCPRSRCGDRRGQPFGGAWPPSRARSTGAFILTLIGNLVFVLKVSSDRQPGRVGRHTAVSVLASSAAERAAKARRVMNAFVGRNRLYDRVRQDGGAGR